ncbi:hypothetical protein AVEN_174356-1 [Araneus ventricosus]|uniref:Uncharacterized protein n=1 Tax=Araneus ventricosus TaxID=182803 RepID=A0A4Y2S449_ARAVE|nr:hypothetical protein AVEN_174356-1 [Araneus ventricosus]
MTPGLHNPERVARTVRVTVEKPPRSTVKGTHCIAAFANDEAGRGAHVCGWRNWTPQTIWSLDTTDDKRRSVKINQSVGARRGRRADLLALGNGRARVLPRSLGALQRSYQANGIKSTGSKNPVQVQNLAPRSDFSIFSDLENRVSNLESISKSIQTINSFVQPYEA